MLDYILERDISQTNYAVPVNGDYTYVSSDYIISNRSSVNKTEAVKFLKFIITELSIGEELYTGSEYIQMIYYLKNVSYETAYMWWRYAPCVSIVVIDLRRKYSKLTVLRGGERWQSIVKNLSIRS